MQTPDLIPKWVFQDAVSNYITLDSAYISGPNNDFKGIYVIWYETASHSARAVYEYFSPHIPTQKLFE